jgi:geranylgeranyl pyrophosphate synthase
MTFSSKPLDSTTVSLSAKITWSEAVRADLEEVTNKIRQVSFLDNQLLDAALNMILSAGGKRMRPALALLVGRACDSPYEKLLSVAASVELLHTATLVHDDVVDEANERRGAPTLHTRLPLGVTVLTGDFLFAQSAALAAEAESVRVVQIFAQTLVSICRGEILQAQTRWQATDQETYMRRIYGKTAALFEAAALSAAILSDAPETTIQAFGAFGHEFGLAFQIVDDALDFMASSQKLGKPAGHDLQQGYITLPALLYLQQKALEPATFVNKIRNEKTVENLIIAIREHGAPHEALQIARQHIAKAEAVLGDLPWSPALDTLVDLAGYVVDRDF